MSDGPSRWDGGNVRMTAMTLAATTRNERRMNS
jgi:hypothetical protein